MKKLITLSSIMLCLLMSFTAVNAQLTFSVEDVIPHASYDPMYPGNSLLYNINSDEGRACISALIARINNHEVSEWLDGSMHDGIWKDDYKMSYIANHCGDELRERRRNGGL